MYELVMVVGTEVSEGWTGGVGESGEEGCRDIRRKQWNEWKGLPRDLSGT